MLFKGVCTALVTPFNKNKKIDYVSAERLIRFQLNSGIKAIMVLGSTGEGLSLTERERAEFVSFARKLIPSSVKLIVGAGGNNAKMVIEQVQTYAQLGADGCLVHTPYFVKCTQRGILNYFGEICTNCALPVIVYNIPSRSGVNILPKTMREICRLPNIAGLKEANQDIEHICQMFSVVNTAIYCGNDNLNGVFRGLGASGTISVASNAFPKQIGQFFEENLPDKFFKFNQLLFCEPNPIPIKYVLHKMGLIQNSLRPPLTKLSRKYQRLLDAELKNLEGV